MTFKSIRLCQILHTSGEMNTSQIQREASQHKLIGVESIVNSVSFSPSLPLSLNMFVCINRWMDGWINRWISLITAHILTC